MAQMPDLSRLSLSHRPIVSTVGAYADGNDDEDEDDNEGLQPQDPNNPAILFNPSSIDQWVETRVDQTMHQMELIFDQSLVGDSFASQLEEARECLLRIMAILVADANRSPRPELRTWSGYSMASSTFWAVMFVRQFGLAERPNGNGLFVVDDESARATWGMDELLARIKHAAGDKFHVDEGGDDDRAVRSRKRRRVNIQSLTTGDDRRVRARVLHMLMEKACGHGLSDGNLQGELPGLSEVAGRSGKDRVTAPWSRTVAQQEKKRLAAEEEEERLAKQNRSTQEFYEKLKNDADTDSNDDGYNVAMDKAEDVAMTKPRTIMTEEARPSNAGEAGPSNADATADAAADDDEWLKAMEDEMTSHMDEDEVSALAKWQEAREKYNVDMNNYIRVYDLWAEALRLFKETRGAGLEDNDEALLNAGKPTRPVEPTRPNKKAEPKPDKYVKPQEPRNEKERNELIKKGYYKRADGKWTRLRKDREKKSQDKLPVEDYLAARRAREEKAAAHERREDDLARARVKKDDEDRAEKRSREEKNRDKRQREAEEKERKERKAAMDAQREVQKQRNEIAKANKALNKQIANRSTAIEKKNKEQYKLLAEARSEGRPFIAVITDPLTDKVKDIETAVDVERGRLFRRKKAQGMSEAAARAATDDEMAKSVK